MRAAYFLFLSFVSNLTFAQLAVPTKCIVVAGNTVATISFEVPFTQFINNNVTYEVQINNNTDYVVCTGSPCAIANLSNGASYTFKIRAKEHINYSAWSESTTAIVPSSIAPDATYAYSSLKQVASEMAQTRVNLASNAGFTAEANTLVTEIQTLQSLVIPVPASPYYGVGFFPKAIINTSSNPYYVSLNNWAANYLSQPITNYTKASTTNFVFTNTLQARNISIDLFRLYWLLVSPESDYRYHPELFRRYLNIIYATSDDYEINGGDDLNVPGSTPNQLDDWFAQYGVVYGWRMALFSFKGFIPQSLQNKIVAATNIMGTAVYNKALSILTDGGYVNRDISYAETLLNCGLLNKNATWYNFSNHIVSQTKATEIYPDGAFSYIWNQNEVANYHAGSIESIARIYSCSGYQPALQSLYLLPQFDLISNEPGFVGEFYTAPAWKHVWNNSRVYSGDFLGYLTENPYYQTLLKQNVTAVGYVPDLLNYTFYKPGIASLPLPNDYLVYDRNIQGPRYRKDDFSYGITTREVSAPGDIGHKTLAGILVTEPAQGQLRDPHSVLAAAYAKVHTESGTTNEWSNWAYLMNIQNKRVALSKTIGSTSTLATLSRQSTGPIGQLRNWGSFQEWLTLPDRMIGLIEVYPTVNNTQAFEVDFRFRFTSGRTAVTNMQTLITNTPNQLYTFGKIELRVLAHNNASIFIAPSGVNRDEGPGEELVFRNGSFNNGVRASYPLTYRRFALVELRKQGAIPNYTISRFDANGIKGIIATTTGKAFSVWRNTTSSSVTLDISAGRISGVPSFVHYSRDDSQTQAPVALTQNTITLAAHQHVLITTSANPEETNASWQNYNELQVSVPALSIAMTDQDAIIAANEVVAFTANAVNMGSNTTYQWQVNGANVGNGGLIFTSNTLQQGNEVSCIMTTTLPNGAIYQVRSNSIRIQISASPPLTFDQFVQDAKPHVAINTITPHRSAAFHIESDSKGLIVSRLSGNAIEAIQAPTEGLLVYALNNGATTVTKPGFWFYQTGAWKYMNVDSDLYDVDNTVNAKRTVELTTNNFVFASANTKVAMDVAFETTKELSAPVFRTEINNTLINWQPNDVGVLLSTSYSGSISLPNATTNVNRIVAVKNISGAMRLFSNTSGGSTGVYATENLSGLNYNAIFWFVSDGISWRVYK